ncbi:MAG: radical SAM protein [Nitrospirota bacterium]|nr:radical SAM protein [Nitrospirota bacterium]
MNRPAHISLLAASYKLKLLRPLNPPFQFSIEPTNVCNFKCVFCPQSGFDHRSNRKRGYLTLENMRSFLSQIREIRPGNRNVSLTLDGEPTLNNDLPEFIRMINAEGLMPRFSSNARMLTPDLIERLAVSGRFLVSVDFADKAASFENIRGREGDFGIVLGNLRHLVEVAGKNRKIQIEIVNISHFSGADPDQSLSDMQTLFPKNLPENIAFRSREFHNFCGHLEKRPGAAYKLCPYPWTSFNVTWEGDVVPCCRDTQAKTVLGNVLNDSIMDIWHGEKYQSLRNALIKKDTDHIEACKHCDLPWSSGSKRWGLKYMFSSLIRR